MKFIIGNNMIKKKNVPSPKIDTNLEHQFDPAQYIILMKLSLSQEWSDMSTNIIPMLNKWNNTRGWYTINETRYVLDHHYRWQIYLTEMSTRINETIIIHDFSYVYSHKRNQNACRRHNKKISNSPIFFMGFDLGSGERDW